MRPSARQQAQSLVEFALVITMFTMLMLALFDWGRTFATYTSLVNGTREAARQTEVTTHWYQTSNGLRTVDVMATELTAAGRAYTANNTPSIITAYTNWTGQPVVNPSGSLTTATATTLVIQALNSTILPLGPHSFTPATDVQVCLFTPGTVLLGSTNDPCNAANNYANNGGHTPAAAGVTVGAGGVLAIHVNYKILFMPLMSGLVPNGYTLTTSSLSSME